MSRSNERDLEISFCCEQCLSPLEDSRPLDIDWRVEVGRTKHLCPRCETVEALTMRTAEKLDTCIEVMEKLPSLFDQFKAEGLGPRQKMKRARDQR